MCTTVVRAMSLNLGMLVSYDESKERLEKYLGKEKANTIWVLSSLISGGIAATMSLPFDNVKTKMQKMTRNPDGTFPYNSLLDCAYKTARNESISGFWAGLPTYIFRIAPHVMIVSRLLVIKYLSYRPWWLQNTSKNFLSEIYDEKTPQEESHTYFIIKSIQLSILDILTSTKLIIL